LSDRIISISPIIADSGFPAFASQSAVGNLKSGIRTNGVLVVTTTHGIHVFRPASAKGAHKSFDEFFCDSATVARFADRGFALVGLFGDGYARAFSLPALKEVGRTKINHLLDVKRYGDAVITPTGDIFGWTGPSEMAMLNVWGTGQPLPKSQDRLYNPQAPTPPRPTISNLQWISGTQYITPSDMDILIGGPDRPPSKRMIAEMREAENAQRVAARSGSRPPPPGPNGEQEGYWAYMQRQVQERTERLGMTEDNMGRLEENSSGWATDVSKFVQKQKRQMVMGAIGSKLGF
jgi:syntaxin-binding protein 5